MREERLMAAATEYGKEPIRKVINEHGGDVHCFVRPDAVDGIAGQFADGARWAMANISEDFAWAIYNFINEWKEGNHGIVSLAEAMKADFSEKDYE